MTGREPTRRGITAGTLSPMARVGLLVACGVLLTGAALWAGSNGPWVARPQATSTPNLPTFDLPTFTPPTVPPRQPPPQTAAAPWNPSVVLYILGGVLVIALLVMAASMIRSRSEAQAGRKRREDREADHVEPLVAQPDPDRPFDAREAADYVIASWEQIERRAASLGSPRRPEQTPTEFLDMLQSTYGLDTSAGPELLSLYQHARFDHHRLQPDTAVRARICAEQLLAGMARTWTVT